MPKVFDRIASLLQIHGSLDALVVRLDLLLVDGLGEGPALLQALDLLLQELVEHVSEGHLRERFIVEPMTSLGLAKLSFLYTSANLRVRKLGEKSHCYALPHSSLTLKTGGV